MGFSYYTACNNCSIMTWNKTNKWEYLQCMFEQMSQICNKSYVFLKFIFLSMKWIANFSTVTKFKWCSYWFNFVVLGIGLRAFHVLDQCSTTDLSPLRLLLIFVYVTILELLTLGANFPFLNGSTNSTSFPKKSSVDIGSLAFGYHLSCPITCRVFLPNNHVSEFDCTYR